MCTSQGGVSHSVGLYEIKAPSWAVEVSWVDGSNSVLYAEGFEVSCFWGLEIKKSSWAWQC